jgi:pilin isopeptide linkage protein/uncharacterized repeat protein (TIGR02543 family)
VLEDGEISGTITASGKDLLGNEILFCLYDGDTRITCTTNDAQGNISFPSTSYKKAGIYNYTIKETATNDGGWTTEVAEWPVTITVTDNGLGALTAAVSYPKGVPLFHYTYKVTPASVTFSAKKTTSGRMLAGGDFSFGVFEGDRLVSSATNKADGSIRFPAVSHTAEGTHHYTIRETSQSGNGWIADSATYQATVTVTNGSSGFLEANVLYPNGTPNFHNAYSQSVVTFHTNGGISVPEQTVLYGDPAQTPAEPTRQGYSFSGWFSDPALTIPYDFNSPVMGDLPLYAGWNRLAHKATIARKILEGATLAAGQYCFQLLDDNGNCLSAVTNDAEGNICFDSGVFKQGTHAYTIQEVVKRRAPRCQYDLTPRPITVTLSAQGEVSVDNQPTFINRYLCANACDGRRY